MNPKSILVVEDDFFQAKALEELLQKHFPSAGIRISRTEEGFEQDLQRFPPSVVIMDCILFRQGQPGTSDAYTSGIRLAKKALRPSTGPTIRIVFRTLVEPHILSPYLKQADLDVPIVGKTVNDDGRLLKLLSTWLA